jgi:hypothetical protein
MKTLNEDFPPLVVDNKRKTTGVHKKLMEARIRLQATKLNKSGHNKFAG